MSEDSRTLWVGNLHEDVTDELVYELFLQTGPIEKLIFPCEGEGADKKHKGHAYVLFKHAESVQFATQVLEGTKLFEKALEMKARSMPVTYRSSPAPMTSHTGVNNRFSRFDNSSLRGGFNRSSTWHGRDDFAPRGRGGGNFRHKGPSNNFNQQQNTNSNYNQGGYNNFNNQVNSGYWMGQQQPSQQQQQMGNDGNVASYSTNMEDKRQRMLQQQNMIISGNLQNQSQQQQQPQQQSQQSMMNMNPQMYNMQQQQQQSQQQQNWGGGNSYSTTTTHYSTDNSWNNMGVSGGNNSNMYSSYSDQYSGWYTQPQ